MFSEDMDACGCRFRVSPSDASDDDDDDGDDDDDDATNDACTRLPASC